MCTDDNQRNKKATHWQSEGGGGDFGVKTPSRVFKKLQDAYKRLVNYMIYKNKSKENINRLKVLPYNCSKAL